MKVLKIVAATIFLSTALTGHAQTGLCSSSASDSDGDGWGWENNMSCRVPADSSPTQPMQPTSTPGPAPIAPITPACSSTNSDPDGDGWGFENGASCRVTQTSSTPALPGGNVQINTPFSSTITGLTTQRFAFNLPSSGRVSLETDFRVAASLRTTILDNNGNVVFEGDTVDFSNFTPNSARPCLVAGNYQLEFERTFIDTANSINYSGTLVVEPANCVAPIRTQRINPDYVELGDNGHVLLLGDTDSQNFSELLTMRDANGNVQWSRTAPRTPESSFVERSEPTLDGGLVLNMPAENLTSSSIILMDNQGQIVWTQQNTSSPFTSHRMVMGNGTVLVPLFDAINAYNLSDGSLRWTFTMINTSSLEDIEYHNGQYIIDTGRDTNTLLTFVE